MRFRFTLRLLLAIVTISAAVLGFGVNFVYGVKEAVRRQQSARTKLAEMGCQFDSETPLTMEQPTIVVSLLRSWIDPKAYDRIGRVYASHCRDVKPLLRELKYVYGLEYLSLDDLTLDAETRELLAVHPNLDLYADSLSVDKGIAHLQARLLPNLAKVFIRDPVDDSCAEFLSRQSQLSSLSLDSSKLSEQGLKAFGKLRALRTISISNRLTNTPSMGSLIAEKELDELQIVIGPKSDTAIRELATAECLSNLHIDIDKGSPQSFFTSLSGALKVENVKIVSNYPITDTADFSKLRACRLLKECELGWTVINADELKSLSRMPRLAKLRFCGAISDSEIWDFLEINPQCLLEMRVPQETYEEYFARRFFLENNELVIEEVPHGDECAVAALSRKPAPLKRIRRARF